jgi:bzd-type benzoyl-CoA reductase Q subunit
MKDSPVTAGIDIGSTTAQAVIIQNQVILAFSNIAAGADRVQTARTALGKALEPARLNRSDIQYIVGTGYGRYQIPFANKNITEITCHARGANYYFPQARTVLDLGGQDCKAISCDDNGKVKAFVMNDKCAAGTGRSMEIIARLLAIPMEEIGPLSLDIKNPPPQLSSGCVIFARSEALRLVRNGVSRNEVLAAYCEAMVNRILPLVQRVGLQEDFVISGGLALNAGIVTRLERKLGIKAFVNSEPQIVGAVGAALIAQQFYTKEIDSKED